LQATFVTKLVVVINDKLHVINEVFFHQLHIWPPYNVYMSDLVTKIVIILVTNCILPHGTLLNLRHIAHIQLTWHIGLNIGHVAFNLRGT